MELGIGAQHRISEMRLDLQRAPLDGSHFDVVVIGGGISGAAIARECARARRTTLLIEQQDFAAGTTSRSTRIIHGGLRYLEHFEFGLVRDSLRESQRLLREKRHLVRPLDFLLALPRDGHRNRLAVRAGLAMYRALAGRRGSTKPSLYVRQFERVLDQGRSWSVFAYEDAQCEFPERWVAEWMVEAMAAGAVVRNYCQALAIDTTAGRVRGVRTRDVLSGREERVSAAWVINATGPWADRVCASSGVHTYKPMIGGVRGSHIVLDRFPAMPDDAVYSEGLDGRPIFLVPWNGQVLVGTTEVPDCSDPADAQPSAHEIEYLVESVRALFPDAGVKTHEVRYVFAGVRPLPYAHGENPAAITRRHLLHDHADDGVVGLISVIGGKLTTAASLARTCARHIGIRVTEPHGFGGLVEFTAADLQAGFQRIAELGRISVVTSEALIEWFGVGADVVARLASQSEDLRQRLCSHTPHIVAEAVFAAQHEFAITLSDILLRRVPIALGACWSQECTQIAARRIGRALEWTEAHVASQIERFEHERATFLHPAGDRNTRSVRRG